MQFGRITLSKSAITMWLLMSVESVEVDVSNSLSSFEPSTRELDPIELPPQD
jgi:hypothetical protein